MFANEQKGLIRALIYPIQFARDPIDGIDHVLKIIVDERALGASRQDYAAAIEAALSSGEPLSQLIPQPHSESTIRAYLSAFQTRLAVSG